jgi:hypothetical protein
MDKKYLVKMMSFLCMGDGNLTMHKGCVNASFHLIQVAGASELICLAVSLLDELRIGYKIEPYRIKGSDKTYIRLRSKVHPFLTKLYHRIYQDGRRTLDPHAFKQLDWEAIAVLYMSDGNIQWSASGVPYAMINLCRLSYAEFMWFRSQVQEKLGLVGNVYKCGKYFRFGFKKKESEEFFTQVRPYVLEEYRYKLPNEKPLDFKGGEIV